MRVMFTPLPGLPHLFNMVPLAWACRAAGHDVRVVSLPELTDVTLSTGLSAIEVGRTYSFLENVLPLASGQRYTSAGMTGLSAEQMRHRGDTALELLVGLADATAADLLAFAERWRPQLVITDPVILAAPLIAARLGIPLLRHLWGPDLWCRMSHPMQGTAPSVTPRDQWPAQLVELYGRFGAAVRNDYAAGTVDPWPGSLQLPGTPGRIPMRFVPYNGATAAPEWVLEGPRPQAQASSTPPRSRVCVTWGTSTTGLGGEYLLPRIVEALSPLDVEVVLAVSAADRDKLGEVPGNCRIAENLPLHLLMSTCAAIVNQAGAGTLLTAACHGVPQVFMPQTAESPFNAARFSTSGASIVLDVAEAGAEAIAAAVTTALTDEAMRAAAHKIRDEIAAAPSPADVVRTLENMTAA